MGGRISGPILGIGYVFQGLGEKRGLAVTAAASGRGALREAAVVMLAAQVRPETVFSINPGLQ